MLQKYHRRIHGITTLNAVQGKSRSNKRDNFIRQKVEKHEQRWSNIKRNERKGKIPFCISKMFEI